MTRRLVREFKSAGVGAGVGTGVGAGTGGAPVSGGVPPPRDIPYFRRIAYPPPSRPPSSGTIGSPDTRPRGRGAKEEPGHSDPQPTGGC